MPLVGITTKEIAIGDILVTDRYRLDLGDLNELTESIKKYDILSTLVVREVPEGMPPYRLLAGGRRMEASKSAGKTTVSCRVYPSTLTDIEVLEIELEENLHRKDLTWQEDVKLKEDITELKQRIHGMGVGGKISGWSGVHTAELLGQSKTSVNRDLELARAMKDMPEIASAPNKTEALSMLKREKDKLIKAEITRRAVAIPKPDMPTFDNYIIGSFFDAASLIERESIDLMELDPPWGVEYDVSAQNAPRTNNTEHYKDWTAEEYIAHLQPLLQTSYNLMRENSWLLLWGGVVFYPQIMAAMEAVGLKPVKIPAMWVKPESNPTMVRSHASLLNGYEVLYYAAKGSPRIINPRNNCFIMTSKHEDRFHPNEKPVELMRTILSIFALPKQTVCIPFLGSGNSLTAADILGMNAYGYDLKQSYKESYVARRILKIKKERGELR